MDINEASVKFLQFGLDGSSVEKPNPKERIETYFSYLKEIKEKILESEVFLRIYCDPDKPDYKECIARKQKLRDLLIKFSIISASSNVSTQINIKQKIDILLKEYDEICKQMDTASEFFNVSE